MTSMKPSRRSVVIVKSADRLISVLEYLANARHATFTEIVRDLKIPSSSMFDLLGTALRRGFIVFDEHTRQYRLGIRLWEVAQGTTSEMYLATISQPFMDELAKRTQETVQLAQLDGRENVYLAISESPHPMKLVSSVGTRLPAHTTGLGKTLLASLTSDQIQRMYSGVSLRAMTSNTITDLDQLILEIQKIRERGYGEDREEYIVGCHCIAMPIRGRNGQVVAAMSVSVPTPRFTSEIEARVHAELSRTMSLLEERLKASPPLLSPSLESDETT